MHAVVVVVVVVVVRGFGRSTGWREIARVR